MRAAERTLEALRRDRVLIAGLVVVQWVVVAMIALSFAGQLLSSSLRSAGY